MRCLVLFCVLGACADPADPVLPPFESEIYRSAEAWLCHPDKPDSVCASNLDTTMVYADGSTELRPHEVAVDPGVDCFYVYPTVSLDSTPNSDMEVGDEETFTTLMQFARYSSVCRTFAPIYRQVTLGSLFTGQELSEEAFEVGYSDVAEAWKHYVAQQNDGRPVLLVGHSQGSRALARLLAREIEPDPVLHERIVGAHLIGMSIHVPEGEVVGGDLATTPICPDQDTWGCVTTFLSFRPSDPPGEDVFVGQPDAGREVPCTHPGVVGELNPVFPSSVPSLVGDFLAGTTTPWADEAAHEAISTPFFAMPELLAGACDAEGPFGYLGVTMASSSDDPRVDDIGGDFLPGWGLHLIDMNLAQDDLVALAERQATLAP